MLSFWVVLRRFHPVPTGQVALAALLFPRLLPLAGAAPGIHPSFLSLMRAALVLVFDLLPRSRRLCGGSIRE